MCIRDSRRILPSSLRRRQTGYRDVRGVRVRTPKIWRLDAGSLSSSQIRALCVTRQDPAGFREVSVGALTNDRTSTAPDIPMALTSEDFWVETRNAIDLRLPIVKSVITFQLLTPTVSRRSVEAATSHILTRIEGLRESFGLDKSALGRGQILDADALGRPLSTVRLARSIARSRWRRRVTARELRHAWDRVLEPALKEFIDVYLLRQEAKREWGTEEVYRQVDTRVLRALKSLDPESAGSLGPTVEEIAYEAGLDATVVAQELEKMKNTGLVYEPRPGHYRLV